MFFCKNNLAVFSQKIKNASEFDRFKLNVRNNNCPTELFDDDNILITIIKYLFLPAVGQTETV